MYVVVDVLANYSACMKLTVGASIPLSLEVQIVIVMVTKLLHELIH